MTNERAKDIMGSMIAQDLGHCGAIASSAITLAAERSYDIEIPMVATIIMLKVLCEKNIQAQLGKDHNQIQQEGYDALEALINDYFDETGGKRVNL